MGIAPLVDYVFPVMPHTGGDWTPEVEAFAQEFGRVLKRRCDDTPDTGRRPDAYSNYSDAVMVFNLARVFRETDRLSVMARFLILPVRASHVQTTYSIMRKMHGEAILSAIITQDHVDAYTAIAEALTDWEYDLPTIPGKRSDTIKDALFHLCLEDPSPTNVKIISMLIRRGVVGESAVREQLAELSDISVPLLEGAL